MSKNNPPTVDPIAAQRWQLFKSKCPLPESPWLHEEVARRMEKRLALIVKQPKRWLDWEPGRGGLKGHQLVAARYSKAIVHVVEPTLSRRLATQQALQTPWWHWQRWAPTKIWLSKPPKPVDMLWANMALHMASQPQSLLQEWFGQLESDGFLMFSCLGPDTLKELRQVYADLGWPAPHHDFTDMHDWGDMLVAAGFAEPVMDMERITLSFSSPQTLLAELRTLGRNLHVNRATQMQGKAWLVNLQQAMVQLSPPQERLNLTFEVIFGHAFKPQQKMKVAPETTVSLAQFKAALTQNHDPND